MAYRMHSALVASLSAAALLLAAGDTFARSGTAPGGVRAGPHSPAVHGFGHHRRHNVGTFWPGGGGYYYSPSHGETVVEAPQSTTRDIRYTYTYDVPWDWAHRYPPNVVPSDRPYVSSCSSEPVTVPGRNGHTTINITRCY